MAQAPRQLKRRFDAEPVSAPAPGAAAMTPAGASAALALDASDAAPAPALDVHERAMLREEMLRELATEREALRRQAVQVANEAREKAEQSGFTAGEEKGIAAGRASLHAEVQRVSAVLSALGQVRAAVLAEAEDGIVEVVFAAVCQMVGDSVASVEQVRSTVQHWQRQVRATDNVTVCLHPDDHALLMHDEGAVAPALNDGVILRADASVHLGGCVVESAQGRLDGRFETHFERLKAALLTTRAARGARVGA
jgi:flagellar assembly protein FliH